MIEKKTSPKGKSVRVTFQLPAEAVENTAAVVGTFNDWNALKNPMTFDAKTGVWSTSVSFKPGETVEFRYLVDETTWRNDEQADGFAASPFFSENSVLEL